MRYNLRHFFICSEDTLVVSDVQNQGLDPVRSDVIKVSATFLRQTRGDHVNTLDVKLLSELITESRVATSDKDIPETDMIGI